MLYQTNPNSFIYIIIKVETGLKKNVTLSIPTS